MRDFGFQEEDPGWQDATRNGLGLESPATGEGITSSPTPLANARRGWRATRCLWRFFRQTS